MFCCFFCPQDSDNSKQSTDTLIAPAKRDRKRALKVTKQCRSSFFCCSVVVVVVQSRDSSSGEWTQQQKNKKNTRGEKCKCKPLLLLLLLSGTESCSLNINACCRRRYFPLFPFLHCQTHREFEWHHSRGRHSDRQKDLKEVIRLSKRLLACSPNLAYNVSHWVTAAA